MKRTLFLTLAVLLLVVATAAPQAVGPVVGKAASLAWDYDLATFTNVTEFRIYLSRTPGIVPDGAPTATVAVPALSWPITSPGGQWYAVVTAFDSTAGIESAPSNETPFFVLGGPANLRVVP